MLVLQTPIPPALNSELLEKETLIWWGRPGQGLLLTGSDWFLVPFSALWLSIPGNAAVVSGSVAAAAFFAFGFFLMVGRFPFDAWLRSRTLYALTDRRAIILRSGIWSASQFVQLDRLSEVSRTGGFRGRETIRFGAPASIWGGKSRLATFSPALDPVPQFLNITEASDVFSAIRTYTFSEQERKHPS